MKNFRYASLGEETLKRNCSLEGDFKKRIEAVFDDFEY